MADDFLRAITPGWDALPEAERAEARRQLNELLDGPLNPTKQAQQPCQLSDNQEAKP